MAKGMEQNNKVRNHKDAVRTYVRSFVNSFIGIDNYAKTSERAKTHISKDEKQRRPARTTQMTMLRGESKVCSYN